MNKFCKLCNKEVDSLIHSLEHFGINFIKEQNPEWVQEDRACPKCIDYYKNLDKIVEVIDPKYSTQDN